MQVKEFNTYYIGQLISNILLYYIRKLLYMLNMCYLKYLTLD